MTYQEYKQGQEIACYDFGFYALIKVAIWKTQDPHIKNQLEIIFPRGKDPNNYELMEAASIEKKPWSFNAIIQAAMREADSDNIIMLASLFPIIFSELKARYAAPGGVLPDDLQLNTTEVLNE